MSNPGIKLSKLAKLIQILVNANHAPNPNARESYIRGEIAKEDQMVKFLDYLCRGDAPKPKTESKVAKSEPIVEEGKSVKKD